MKKSRFLILFYCSFLVNTSLIVSQEQEQHRGDTLLSSSSHNLLEKKPLSNELLIFLDDSESSLGAITGVFLTAFDQKAGIVLVSASVIANVLAAEVPGEKNLKKMKSIFDCINIKPFSIRTVEEEKSQKEILVSVLSFRAHLATDWVIKEVSPLLYLLVPHSYIEKNGLKINDVQKFLPDKSSTLTEIEERCGLKVNHLKTVTLDEIKKPDLKPVFADYFMTHLSDLFVSGKESKKEYLLKDSQLSEKSKFLAPSWSIYILGHGFIRDRICSLSIEQFKSFLAFLETIKTNILVYNSCYSSGVNASLLYGDAESGIDKTYPFVIVAQTLTDAYGYGTCFSLNLKGESIEVVSGFNFKKFFDLIISAKSNCLDALKFITYNYVSTTPQIKYAGLPWFSILDYGKVASIGSILAKTHSTALNIATFFAKKGQKKAAPIGILLYAENIPFKIIIDTFDGNFYIPKIVSMVPDKIRIYLKEIESSKCMTDQIIDAFFIEGLLGDKVFIIDTLSAQFSYAMRTALSIDKGSGKLYKVVIEATTKKTYFTYNGSVYYIEGALKARASIKIANSVEKERYEMLLKNAEVEPLKNTDAPVGQDSVFDKKTTSTMSSLKRKARQKYAALPNENDKGVEKCSLKKLLTQKVIEKISNMLQKRNNVK